MERPKRQDPEHLSPEVVYRIFGAEAVFHYYNTDVFTFEGNDSLLDHVYYRPTETSSGILIFDAQKKIEELIGLQFPNHHLPWANDGQREAYMRYQSNKLEAELRQLEGGTL